MARENTKATSRVNSSGSKGWKKTTHSRIVRRRARLVNVLLPQEPMTTKEIVEFVTEVKSLLGKGKVREIQCDPTVNG